MGSQAIACDYDRTLADEGRVAPQTLDVLRRVREEDRKLILITGRTLDDLRTVFSELSVFNTVVVENGATLLDPALGSEEPLCAPPPLQFLALLQERRVPFSVGKRVGASVRSYETSITRLIEELNLDLEVAFNRESILVLPSVVDKAAALTTALSRLGLKPSGVVGIGGAENDISVLRLSWLRQANSQQCGTGDVGRVQRSTGDNWDISASKASTGVASFSTWPYVENGASPRSPWPADAELGFLTLQALVSLLRKHPELCQQLLTILSAKVAHSEQVTKALLRNEKLPRLELGVT